LRGEGELAQEGLISSLSCYQRDSQVPDEDPRKENHMPGDVEQRDNVVVAGSTCPVAECSSLVFAYRSHVNHDHGEPWDFTCPRCGTEFLVPKEDLLLHSVPLEWLLAKTHIV
jgi:hypothetical protein